MLTGFIKVQPLKTRARAMRAYVPLLLWNRGIGFLRLLLVARILGEVGKPQYALFQMGQYFINWIVPVLMLGMDSIAERYASRHLQAGNLAPFFGRHFRRLVITGAAALAALILLSGPLARLVFGNLADASPARWLIILAGLDIAVLAIYQWIAATLRGLQAYQTGAGMETVAAGLLFLFSLAAAYMDGAAALLIAYGASTLVPLAWYGLELRRFANAQSTPAASAPMEGLGWFGAWSQARLILVMTVAFVGLRGVAFLASGDKTAVSNSTADYALAYSVAQVLMYMAATLWSSTYALAAGRYSAGSARQATYQFLQVGKFGAIALLFLGTMGFVAGEFVIRRFLPAYGPGVGPLLAPMIGLFFWYGVLAFLVSLGDLQERPWAGAAMWGLVVVMQIATISAWNQRAFLPAEVAHFLAAVAPAAQWAVLLGSAVGAGMALLAARLLLRPEARLFPIGALALAGAGFFMPAPMGPIWASAILLVLAGSGVLVRRREWRKLSACCSSDR